MAFENINLGIFKILRLLRVLRPLKIISKNEGLRISIGALLYAIPSVFNVLLISLLFFMIFGIIGVNFLKGSLFSCHTVLADYTEFINTKWDCYNSGGSWVDYPVNFNDITNSIQTLFGMANTVGWAHLMYRGAWSRGIDKNPY